MFFTFFTREVQLEKEGGDTKGDLSTWSSFQFFYLTAGRVDEGRERVEEGDFPGLPSLSIEANWDCSTQRRGSLIDQVCFLFFWLIIPNSYTSSALMNEEL